MSLMENIWTIINETANRRLWSETTIEYNILITPKITKNNLNKTQLLYTNEVEESKLHFTKIYYHLYVFIWNYIQNAIIQINNIII
jgi:hypothetical protein